MSSPNVHVDSSCLRSLTNNFDEFKQRFSLRSNSNTLPSSTKSTTRDVVKKGAICASVALNRSVGLARVNSPKDYTHDHPQNHDHLWEI